MTIEFEAPYVSCSQGNGGEIVQVTFDSVELRDEEDRRTPYVALSQCFEFPGPPSLEWYDGRDYRGAGIRSIVLSRNAVRIRANDSTDFAIAYDVAEDRYLLLKRLLGIIFPDCRIEDRT